MYCPKCLSEKTVVNKTIKTQNTNERYRQCQVCKFTFVTLEAIKTDAYWSEYAKYTLESNSESEFEQASLPMFDDKGE